MVHAVDPVMVLSQPFGQCLQLVLLPIADEYVLLKHFVHCVEPLFKENRPAVQFLHVLEDV